MKHFLTLLTALVLTPLAALRAADTEALFVRRIVPLLHEKCLACHGNDRRAHVLRCAHFTAPTSKALKDGADVSNTPV